MSTSRSNVPFSERTWASLALPPNMDLGTGPDSDDEEEFQSSSVPAPVQTSPLSLHRAISRGQPLTQARLDESIALSPGEEATKTTDGKRFISGPESLIKRTKAKAVDYAETLQGEGPQAKPTIPTPPTSTPAVNTEAANVDPALLKFSKDQRVQKGSRIGRFPRFQTGDSMKDFAAQCAPVFMHMAGLPTDTEASSAVLSRIADLLQEVRKSDAGSSKENPIELDDS